MCNWRMLHRGRQWRSGCQELKELKCTGCRRKCMSWLKAFDLGLVYQPARNLYQVPSVFKSKGVYWKSVVCAPKMSPQEFIWNLLTINLTIRDSVINLLIETQPDTLGAQRRECGWVLTRTGKNNRQVCGLQGLTVWLKREDNRVRKVSIT